MGIGRGPRPLRLAARQACPARLAQRHSVRSPAAVQVKPLYADWEARHGPGLPPHQAAMALEAEGGRFAVAINNGTQGDLSRQQDWHILPQ
eukprot:gene11891-2167_t